MIMEGIKSERTPNSEKGKEAEDEKEATSREVTSHSKVPRCDKYVIRKLCMTKQAENELYTLLCPRCEKQRLLNELSLHQEAYSPKIFDYLKCDKMVPLQTSYSNKDENISMKTGRKGRNITIENELGSQDRDEGQMFSNLQSDLSEIKKENFVMRECFESLKREMEELKQDNSKIKEMSSDTKSSDAGLEEENLRLKEFLGEIMAEMKEMNEALHVKLFQQNVIMAECLKGQNEFNVEFQGKICKLEACLDRSEQIKIDSVAMNAKLDSLRENIRQLQLEIKEANKGFVQSFEQERSHRVECAQGKNGLTSTLEDKIKRLEARIKYLEEKS